MVKKIRRKIKAGKGSSAGYPAVLLMTPLFGPRREGRLLPGPWEAPGRLAEFFQDHFGATVTSADRPIGPRRFREWIARARWEELGLANWPGGAFPVSDLGDEPAETGAPLLACLPILVSAPRREAEGLLERLGSAWTEVQETAYERWTHDAFNAIPGYDRVVHAPLARIGAANRAIDILNLRVRDEFDRAGLSTPSPFPPFPPEVLARVPGEIVLPAPPAL